ncbi:heterokaryon incompatibility protein [Apiospora phragmitis]|uniref:Heterokaryon incompatibility protein n=1 Tax=Apiospora phragmitis TaxID=2905665 RepID=A0ABR1WSE9_9PEZI
MAFPGPYGYEPLSKPNDIRLLDILPGATTTIGEPPSISLRTANLSDSQDFEALSYVWGDTNRTEEILCNGHCVRVTRNLRDALAQLRLPDQPRTLWADALCINQANLDEKSRQILIMHRIYQACRRCVVWLGRADEHTDAALDMVQLFAELVCRKVNVSTMEELDNHLKVAGYDLMQARETGYSELLPPKDSPKWISLFSLLCRPWFTRIWVILEAFFSRELLFHCGARPCRYSALYYAADWILNNGQPITYATHFAGPSPGPQEHGVTRFNVMHTRSDADADEEPTKRLAYLLSTFEKFRATDPRDKVYALMHLPAFRREYPDIVLDYRLSAGRVLEQGRDFQMLTRIDRDRTQYPDEAALCLPSWVPRWHRTDASPVVSYSWYRFMSVSGKSEKAKAAQAVGLLAPPLDHFSSSLPPPARKEGGTTIIPTNAVLGVRGFEFDVVHDVCELEFRGRRVPDEHRIPLFRTHTGPWERYRPQKAAEDPSPTLSTIPLPRMPLRDRARGRHRARTLLRRENGEVGGGGGLVDNAGGLDDNSKLPPGDFYPPGLYAAERPTLLDADAREVAEMSRRYSIMAWSYSMGRCLFRTRRGYLRTGPRDVRRRGPVHPAAALGGRGRRR